MMIQKEYLEYVHHGEYYPFREKMAELIFNSKKYDGQKGSRIQKEIVQDLQNLDRELKLMINYYIKECQKYNIPPNMLEVDSYQTELLFYCFKNFQIKPIKQMLSIDFDGIFINPITYNNEYIEKKYIDKLIEKWYILNKIVPPKNNKKVDFYCDFEFKSSIIEHQKNLMLQGRIEEINFLKNCKIYYYYKNNRYNKNKLKILKNNLNKFVINYRCKVNLLCAELDLSDRGDIWVDSQNLLMINGNLVFEFYSKFFFDFFDGLFELHKKSPDLFGKGANLIIEGLYHLIKSKDEFSELHFLKDIEAFKLQLQKSYAYFGDTEKGLRVDLFRNLVNDKKNNEILTFEGGLFHILRHFHNENIPLSATYEGGHQFYKSYFFDTLREAFWVSKWSKCGDNKIKSKIRSIVNKDKNYNFVFYKNPNVNGLYYIDTVHLENINK